jgi:hypothetical protein
VAVGKTTFEPFSGTGVPFKSALTAFTVFHVSVVLPPGATEVGLALIPAATAPLVTVPTVTVIWPASVAPVEL